MNFVNSDYDASGRKVWQPASLRNIASRNFIRATYENFKNTPFLAEDMICREDFQTLCHLVGNLARHYHTKPEEMFVRKIELVGTFHQLGFISNGPLAFIIRSLLAMMDKKAVFEHLEVYINPYPKQREQRVKLIIAGCEKIEYSPVCWLYLNDEDDEDL